VQKALRSDDIANSAMGWVPRAALNYLAHTEGGLSIRALARKAGCHASTVSRQVRAFEARRDDMLVDDALRKLGAHVQSTGAAGSIGKDTRMTTSPECDQTGAPPLTEARLHDEARRVLRRLCEPGAILAVAAGMDKAVVMRDTPGGSSRTTVVDRDVSEAMALNGWINCDASGRVSRYRITGAGRSVLAQLLAKAENKAQGLGTQQEAEGASKGQAPRSDETPRRMRYGTPDSPLICLARRRDRDGTRFLSVDLVRAGERLREDFEMAQMSLRAGESWDSFLNGEVSVPAPSAASDCRAAARARVLGVLCDLGPGLGDVVLRCCCYLEGLETAEREMGWSARSGKIVLRIALQRLKRHYDSLGEEAGLMG
jgi:lambda repressor-like predicted transcriptional regulator